MLAGLVFFCILIELILLMHDEIFDFLSLFRTSIFDYCDISVAQILQKIVGEHQERRKLVTDEVVNQFMTPRALNFRPDPPSAKKENEKSCPKVLAQTN